MVEALEQPAVDLVTDATRSAADVARDVRRALVAELAVRDLRARTTRVAVLSVERATGVDDGA